MQYLTLLHIIAFSTMALLSIIGHLSIVANVQYWTLLNTITLLSIIGHLSIVANVHLQLKRGGPGCANLSRPSGTCTQVPPLNYWIFIIRTKANPLLNYCIFIIRAIIIYSSWSTKTLVWRHPILIECIFIINYCCHHMNITYQGNQWCRRRPCQRSVGCQRCDSGHSVGAQRVASSPCAGPSPEKAGFWNGGLYQS